MFNTVLERDREIDREKERKRSRDKLRQIEGKIVWIIREQRKLQVRGEKYKES